MEARAAGMSKSIEIKCGDQFLTPNGYTATWIVDKWRRCQTLSAAQQILIDLLLAGFSFLLLIGCANPSPELTAMQLALRTADTEILKVAESTHTEVKSNTQALAEIKAKLETMEASLVVSDPANGKEVIKSEDTSPADNANDSQPVTRSVAEAGDVPLFVTNAPFPCPPCERLKADYAAGKFAGFDVTFADDWQPSSYPAIRYKSANSATGWAVIYGYDANTIDQLKRLTGTKEIVVAAESTNSFMSHGDMVSIHNDLHGGGSWTWPGDIATHLRQSHGVQIDGTAANYQANTVVRARSVISTSSRRPVVSWRSRSVLRSSCPGGRCP